MRKIFVVTLIIMLILIAFPCRGIVIAGDKKGGLLFFEELKIPDGYKFVAASAHGEYTDFAIYYIQHNESGRVFEYHEVSGVGSEIISPKDCTLVGASAFGTFKGFSKFYYLNNKTGRIVIYKLKAE